jgi:hypothetical protein
LIVRIEYDEVFAGFVEERREFGFQGDRLQERQLMRRPMMTLIAIALGSGLMGLLWIY